MQESVIDFGPLFIGIVITARLLWEAVYFETVNYLGYIKILVGVLAVKVYIGCCIGFLLIGLVGFTTLSHNDYCKSVIRNLGRYTRNTVQFLVLELVMFWLFIPLFDSPLGNAVLFIATPMFLIMIYHDMQRAGQKKKSLSGHPKQEQLPDDTLSEVPLVPEHNDQPSPPRYNLRERKRK